MTIQGALSFEGIYDLVVHSVDDLSPEDFIRIVIQGDIDPEVDLDVQLIKVRLENEYYYIEVKDKTQLDLDMNQLALDYKDSLIGMYIQTMLAMNIEEPVVSDALNKGLRLLLDEQVKL